ncbi:hypothetical protein [Spiroplasma endosymbiont of Villa modesta]|uniref:hypothetical protein n=1 Tax=Spiroplasma endosymbiont of Villa modesta TaxID=3066293 RepID=UPI00313AD3A5
MLIHESNKLNKFLKPNHEWVFGDTTIWEHKNNYDIYLYFANKPASGSSDFKWDGTYPKGYFKD